MITLFTKLVSQHGLYFAKKNWCTNSMKNAIMAIWYTREKQNVGFEQTSKSISGVIMFIL